MKEYPEGTCHHNGWPVRKKRMCIGCEYTTCKMYRPQPLDKTKEKKRAIDPNQTTLIEIKE